jgi:protein-S-isoprenylcysteine O-methyltransferase Ste14
MIARECPRHTGNCSEMAGASTKSVKTMVMAPKWISLTGFAILVLAIVGLIASQAILAVTPTTIAAQVLAVLLMLWARKTFGLRSFHAAANPTEGGLVTIGPYKYIRHPIYASILLFLTAAVLSNLSLASIFMELAAAIGVAMRIWSEERLLLERYPEYGAYAAKTSRIIPFLL